MKNPRTKSGKTLVTLGFQLDQCVMTLARLNHTSYAQTVRTLCLLGVRGLIRSGSFQGWTVPAELEEMLESGGKPKENPLALRELP